jgi:hypothetical protein
MRRAILGVLAGVGLTAVALALSGQRGEALAQRVVPPTAGGELIAVPTPLGDKGQLLTVIDPRQQVIGVYAIDGPTGKISLRSVRNIHYDLSMIDFNGQRPLPQEIRAQLDQR